MSEQEQHGEKEHKKHEGGHGGHGGGMHGGSHEEHEGPAEWIVSFADNVALLMGFFVILVAFSMNKPSGGGNGENAGAAAASAIENSPEFLDAVISIREAFHNPVNVNSTNPREALLVRRILERHGQVPLNENGPPGQKYRMQSIRPSKYYNLCGSVPFDDNSSELSDDGREAVMGILEHLRGLRLIVAIRGHVSAAEAANAPDRGLRLSFDRALAVAALLSENEIEWRRIRLMACGDGDRLEPVAYGKSDQGPNQRVEVVLTEELMPEYTPTTDSPAPAPAAE